MTTPFTFSPLLISRTLMISALFYPALLYADAETPSQQRINELTHQSAALIAQKHPEKAFELLHAYEDQLAGQEHYDYWLGLAAARSNQLAHAQFAFERTVATNPNHAAARLELVPIYLANQMNTAAERELNILDTLNPPENAQAVMAHYRSILEERKKNAHLKHRIMMIGVDVGHDSNVSSTPTTTLTLPVFNLPIKLSPSASEFATLRMMAWQRLNFSNADWVSVSAYGLMRKNKADDARAYDLGLLQLRADYTRELGVNHHIRAAVEGSQLWLEGEKYRRHAGLSFRTQRPFSPQVHASVEAGYRSFVFENSQHDYLNPWLQLSLNYQPDNRPYQLSAQVQLEHEDAQGQRIQGNSRRVQLTLSGDYQLTRKHQIGLSTNFAHVEHDRPYLARTLYNPLSHNQTRRDTVNEISLHWSWYPTSLLNVGMRAVYRKQDSNISFYDYDQTLLQFSTNYFF